MLGSIGSALSVFLHWLIWREPRQSISARAWDRRLDESWAWWAVVILGRRHCEQAWRWHREEVEPWEVKW